MKSKPSHRVTIPHVLPLWPGSQPTEGFLGHPEVPDKSFSLLKAVCVPTYMHTIFRTQERLKKKKKAINYRGTLNMPVTNMNKSSMNCIALVN